LLTDAMFDLPGAVHVTLRYAEEKLAVLQKAS
jgi:hypothetical protein